MSTLPPRAAALAAVFVLLTAALLPLPARAQVAANPQWSTYLGGTEADQISVVTKVDDSATAVGVTRSASLAVSAPAGARSSADIFVAHFSLDTGALPAPPLVFGGDGIDEPAAVAVGALNDLYIVGKTTSISGFVPTTDVVHQPMPGNGTSGFVARVLADGTLDWFMFLGGNGDDAATGVVIVGSHLYVSGWTRSTNFMQSSLSVPAGSNGFVVEIRVTPGGPVLGWMNQPLIIGGEGDDSFQGITLASENKLYVAGTTTSSLGFAYPPDKVVGAYKGGLSDAIVAKVDLASASMDWVTFVGGGGADLGNAIATGPVSQSVVVTGTTNSPDNLGPGDPLSQTNAFVAWLHPTGLPKFSEVLQGTFNDEALAITTDSNGNAYVGGKTASSDFPRLNSSGFDKMIEGGAGIREGFVWMAPSEGGAGWVSLVGGNNADEVTSLFLRDGLQLLLGLKTESSTGLPGSPGTPPSYDMSLSGLSDGYLLRANVSAINAPAPGQVFDRHQDDNTNEDEQTTTSTSSIYANWTGFFEAAGSIRYEWAVGTQEAPTSIKPWTSVGTNISAGDTDLSLEVGRHYIVTVRATNNYGLTSIARSNGVLVTYPDGGVPPPIPDAGTPDGGTGNPDSGTGTPDGGPNRPDAGSDGGTTNPPDGGGGGGPDEGPESAVGWDLGCASGGGAAPLFLSLLALVLLGRRLRAR